MAWIRYLNHRLFLKFTSVIGLFLLTYIQQGHSVFDCDPVNLKKKCFCTNEPDSGWVIECPAGKYEIYNISLTVIPTADLRDEATLVVKCNWSNRDFPWELLQGVDFQQDLSYTVTKLEINYCSSLVLSDGFDGFFKQINISSHSIRAFTFYSNSAVTLSLPNNFLSLMPNLESLNLRGNKLNSMPNLSSLPNLKDINLRNNQLMGIPRNAFRSNQKLTNVALNGNNLTKIEKDTFPPLVSFLDLQSNKISTLTHESFASLQKLEALFLDNNPLDNVEVTTFQNMPAIKQISLRGNLMKEYPVFENLSTLTKLSISHGKSMGMRTDNVNATQREDRDKGVPIEIILRNLSALNHLYIQNIPFHSISVFENLPSLEVLKLPGNELEQLPTLSNFPQLKTLDVSNNLLKSPEIPTRQLKTLNLNENRITSLEKKSFQLLNQLTELSLKGNQITSVDPKAFEPLTQLVKVDLSYNNISFEMTNVVNPEYSEIPRDFLDVFGDYSPLSPCLKLKSIDLSHNSINQMFNDWSNTMTSLEILNLSFNKFQSLLATDINFVSGNVTLDLSNNEISRIDMKQASVFLEDQDLKLVSVKLGGNPLHCDCNAYYLKIFRSKSYRLHIDQIMCHGPEKLKSTPLSLVNQNELVCQFEENCPHNCRCFDRPSDKSVMSDCSLHNLTNIVKIEENFSKLINDKRFRNGWEFDLDLSKNQLSTFALSFESDFLEHIRLVNLSSNRLQSISFLQNFLKNNRTSFAFSDNPFPCSDCQEFQLQLRTFAQRIVDVDNVTCIMSAEDHKDDVDLQVPKIVIHSKYEDMCPFFMSLQLRAVIIAVGILTGLFVLIIAVYIRHGWAIRAYCFANGMSCCFCEDELDDEEKTYDAFVSYSHQDHDWVISELVNRLEGKDGFKLCLHFRDWTAGDWIPDQIVRSVDRSRRTIVILSKNFVESVWSRLEFKAAHSQALTDKTNRLILIVMGDDLTDKDVKDDDLKIYMKMNTYLKWNDPWFWHKLKYALPHKRNSEDDRRNLIKEHEQRERAIQLDKLRVKLEQTV